MGMDDRQGYTVSRLQVYDGRGIFVRGTSSTKPEVPPQTVDKWQRFINHVAQSLKQPHALITRLDHDTLYVFLHNETDDTTFVEHDSFPLGLGVYCETTMTGNTVNFVPNALSDDNWKENPSVAFSLTSYIGVPTRWPDGEIFGTICGLGDKPLREDQTLFDNIILFKGIVETDLQLLFEQQKNEQSQEFYNNAISEVHHRVKNHLNILCGLIQRESKSRQMNENEYVEWQDKLNNQIKAVSELHSLLAYKDHDRIELSEYLTKIIDGWIKATLNNEVRVDAVFDRVTISSDKVIYLGILLNELITNSLSHAFPQGSDPKITMTLQDEGEMFRFRYKDNGPGLPEGFKDSDSSSLGMSLICGLTTSLGGTVLQSNDGGASFEFVFPKQLG